MQRIRRLSGEGCSYEIVGNCYSANASEGIRELRGNEKEKGAVETPDKVRRKKRGMASDPLPRLEKTEKNIPLADRRWSNSPWVRDRRLRESRNGDYDSQSEFGLRVDWSRLTKARADGKYIWGI